MSEQRDKGAVVSVTVEYDGRKRTFEMPRPEGATPEQMTRAVTRAASVFGVHVRFYELADMPPAPPRPKRSQHRRPNV